MQMMQTPQWLQYLDFFFEKQVSSKSKCLTFRPIVKPWKLFFLQWQCKTELTKDQKEPCEQLPRLVCNNLKVFACRWPCCCFPKTTLTPPWSQNLNLFSSKNGWAKGVKCNNAVLSPEIFTEQVYKKTDLAH